MIIYAKLQSSRLRHQFGIFGGKSQTPFSRNSTQAGSEEGRLFSQATCWTILSFSCCRSPEVIILNGVNSASNSPSVSLNDEIVFKRLGVILGFHQSFHQN